MTINDVRARLPSVCDVDDASADHLDIAEDFPDSLSVFRDLIHYFGKRNLHIAFVDRGDQYVWRITLLEK